MEQDKQDSSYNADHNLALKELQECQKSKNTQSCMDCDKLLDCKIRDKFVSTTYSKMSQGDSGGFEF